MTGRELRTSNAGIVAATALTELHVKLRRPNRSQRNDEKEIHQD